MSDLSSLLTNVNDVSNIILVNPQVDLGITAQVPTALQKPSISLIGAVQALLPAIAPPVPQPSFLFHYTGEDTVQLTSDITDHFIEDNTALQDQISLKPEIVTTHGYIGELNNVPSPALKLLKTVTDKLQTLAPFVPAIASSATTAYNTAAQASQTANNAARAAGSVYASITGKNLLTGAAQDNPVQTEQQKAFVQFYGYWKARQLFTIQTPWAIFKDMAILTLRAVQEEDSRMVSNFEITFKQIRVAKTLVTAPVMQGRAAASASAIVDLGVSKPVPSIGVAAAITASGVAK